MGNTIETLDDVIVSMDRIYDRFASDEDKIKREMHQIEGAIEYIDSCKYMTDDVKDREVRVLLNRSNILAIQLMSILEKDMQESRCKHEPK